MATSNASAYNVGRRQAALQWREACLPYQESNSVSCLEPGLTAKADKTRRSNSPKAFLWPTNQPDDLRRMPKDKRMLPGEKFELQKENPSFERLKLRERLFKGRQRPPDRVAANRATSIKSTLLVSNVETK